MSAYAWEVAYRRADELLYALEHADDQQPALFFQYRPDPRTVVAELLAAWAQEDGNE